MYSQILYNLWYCINLLCTCLISSKTKCYGPKTEAPSFYPLSIKKTYPLQGSVFTSVFLQLGCAIEVHGKILYLPGCVAGEEAWSNQEFSQSTKTPFFQGKTESECSRSESGSVISGGCLQQEIWIILFPFEAFFKYVKAEVSLKAGLIK